MDRDQELPSRAQRGVERVRLRGGQSPGHARQGELCDQRPGLSVADTAGPAAAGPEILQPAEKVGSQRRGPLWGGPHGRGDGKAKTIREFYSAEFGATGRISLFPKML